MPRHQPHSHRKRPPLPARECQVVWRTNNVHYRIRIRVPADVDSRYPHRPFVPSKLESLFQPEIQAKIIRKSQLVWRADKLSLVIQYAERESSAVLEKFTEQ